MASIIEITQKLMWLTFRWRTRISPFQSSQVRPSLYLCKCDFSDYIWRNIGRSIPLGYFLFRGKHTTFNPENGNFLYHKRHFVPHLSYIICFLFILQCNTTLYFDSYKKLHDSVEFVRRLAETKAQNTPATTSSKVPLKGQAGTVVSSSNYAYTAVYQCTQYSETLPTAFRL